MTSYVVETVDRSVGMTPAQTQVDLSVVSSASGTNLMGTIHGGDVMKLVDDAAGVVSARFSGGPAVTAAMDEMAFLAPVRVGDLIHVRAKVTWAGRSSMEVGVKVETTRWNRVAEPVHVATAHLVMVAVDEVGKPRQVPKLLPENDDDRRRAREAQVRREHRLARREALKALADEEVGEGAESLS